MTLAEIFEAIKYGRYRVTDHADEEAAEDALTLNDVLSSVAHGEVIEAYLTDVPYPSCLILGQTPGGVPIHSVWAYNSDNQWAVLVTVYRPDPMRWVDWRQRRNPQ